MLFVYTIDDSLRDMVALQIVVQYPSRPPAIVAELIVLPRLADGPTELSLFRDWLNPILSATLMYITESFEVDEQKWLLKAIG